MFVSLDRLQLLQKKLFKLMSMFMAKGVYSNVYEVCVCYGTVGKWEPIK